MIKRLLVVTVVMALLAVPSTLFAAEYHRFGVGNAVAKSATIIVVPLEISNLDNLVALDIPLKFSEGVTLKEVDFTDTRIEYFDFKITNIDNENNTVIIGAMPQMSYRAKADLEAGSGVMANLVFEIDDPSITSVTIEAIEMSDPYHKLMFVYHDYNADGSIAGIRAEYPAFADVVVGSDPIESVLPTVFALDQNYPNPFNPSTEISFALPTSGHVSLIIYNVLGQEVETLVDEHMDAGNHTVTWEASSYSSGVYFYRLIADNDKFVKTNKMMVLK
ncbi:MAG: T9SS type A sorting domain-containing protein [candidate division Zixibacteria bacterium]|nr:T9SS type A sorting domain-containing protein [candidate division Zixibacteria bacterium]